jgi:anti-sigma B factor antagonist
VEVLVMTQLTATTRTSAGQLRIALAGEIDLTSLDVLSRAQEQALADASARGVPVVVVDLDRVTFLDSTGIGVLVAGYRHAAGDGLTFRLENPHGIVARVLDVAGVLPTLAPARRAA